MPVNALNKTRWEEQATAKYLLDPDTGRPAVSRSSPLNVNLPSLDFLGGTSFSLDGSLPKWLVASDGATVITIAANGGEVYYEINGVTANAGSPGYVADGFVQRIGPACNMSSLWTFSSTADTMVHVNFYRETGSALAGTWRAIRYWEQVLATNPIAFWPQSETVGTTAHCLVNPAQNGTYTGVTLANDLTGPFGTPAPFFDGATSVNNVYTAALVAAFNGSAGSMMAWAKVNAAGIWTDGNYHCVMDLGADGNNYIDLFKWNTNNNLSWRYRAAGATSQRLKAGMTTTDWMLLAITWDDVANEMKAFFNGTQEGATVAIANNWAGALGAIRCVIGASTSAPVSFPWHGGVGPCAIWDRVLPPAEMATMYIM